MASVKHLDIVRINVCHVVDAAKAQKKSENSADKIQITLAACREVNQEFIKWLVLSIQIQSV